jgi:PadR family transcriptional regulator, regulatory protein PadR
MISKAGPKKVTQPTLQVLARFVDQPTRKDWFGLELCRQTGLGSGTVTQILFRLDQWGWIQSRWEDAAEAHRQGHPPRRFYQLTGLGEREGRRLLQQQLHRLRRWPAQGGMA